MRLGIGHPGRKELVAAYVLHDFAKADEGWLDDVLRGLSDGAPHLVEGDRSRFQNAVAARVAPSDPKPAKKPAAAPQPTPEPEAPDTRNPLQRLADKFR